MRALNLLGLQRLSLRRTLLLVLLPGLLLVVGAELALQMIVSGEPIGANAALKAGLVDRIVRWRIALLLLAVLLAVGASVLAPRLKFDRSVEKMFPADSPLLASYQKLKRTFGGNEIVLAVYQDPDLFATNGVGIRRVADVARRLGQVAGVKAVLSIDQPLPGELIVSDNPLARRTRELFRGYTHGSDQQPVSVVCMLHPENETSTPRRHERDANQKFLPAGQKLDCSFTRAVRRTCGRRCVPNSAGRLCPARNSSIRCEVCWRV